MIKIKEEGIELKDWKYERFKFESNILKQSMNCGFLRHNSNTEITTTIYLFHGGGADDAQAVQAGVLPLLVDTLNLHSGKNIQIVFPYIGNSFLNKNIKSEESFSCYFLNEIIPACEERTQTSAATRFVCGWSMGGQAALNMFLRNITLFGGVGAHFPTLINFDFTKSDQKSEYAFRHGLDENKMSVLINDFEKVFGTYDSFLSHDPIKLIDASLNKLGSVKKIYFDVGSEDEFGLFEGAEKFNQKLREKSIKHGFQVVPGGKHDGAFIHSQIPKMLSYLL